MSPGPGTEQDVSADDIPNPHPEDPCYFVFVHSSVVELGRVPSFDSMVVGSQGLSECCHTRISEALETRIPPLLAIFFFSSE